MKKILFTKMSYMCCVLGMVCALSACGKTQADNGDDGNGGNGGGNNNKAQSIEGTAAAGAALANADIEAIDAAGTKEKVTASSTGAYELTKSFTPPALFRATGQAGGRNYTLYSLMLEKNEIVNINPITNVVVIALLKNPSVYFSGTAIDDAFKAKVTKEKIDAVLGKLQAKLEEKMQKEGLKGLDLTKRSPFHDAMKADKVDLMDVLLEAMMFVHQDTKAETDDDKYITPKIDSAILALFTDLEGYGAAVKKLETLTKKITEALASDTAAAAATKLQPLVASNYTGQVSSTASPTDREKFLNFLLCGDTTKSTANCNEYANSTASPKGTVISDPVIEACSTMYNKTSLPGGYALACRIGFAQRPPTQGLAMQYFVDNAVMNSDKAQWVLYGNRVTSEADLKAGKALNAFNLALMDKFAPQIGSSGGSGPGGSGPGGNGAGGICPGDGATGTVSGTPTSALIKPSTDFLQKNSLAASLKDSFFLKLRFTGSNFPTLPEDNTQGEPTVTFPFVIVTRTGEMVPIACMVYDPLPEQANALEYICGVSSTPATPFSAGQSGTGTFCGTSKQSFNWSLPSES